MKIFIKIVFVFKFSDFEVYLKSKIVEIHAQPNDEGVSCCSDPIGVPECSQNYSLMSKLAYNPLGAGSTRKSVTNDSKVSVYFTPNDSVDQPQIQISPLHINYIRENLDSYLGCLKPAVSNPKFDFDMHRMQANLEKEIDRRRSQYRSNSEDYESAGDGDGDGDEVIEIDTEKTKMLNSTNETDDINDRMYSETGFIRLNTLPKRHKFRRATGSKDLYYSLENVFDMNVSDSNYYQMRTSTKTIDEASETQLTSSASDNCSSSDTNHSNQLNGDGGGSSNPSSNSNMISKNPSQSLLELNHNGFNATQTTSSSMPNICDSTKKCRTKESNGQIEIFDVKIENGYGTENNQTINKLN